MADGLLAAILAFFATVFSLAPEASAPVTVPPADPAGRDQAALQAPSFDPERLQLALRDLRSAIDGFARSLADEVRESVQAQVESLTPAAPLQPQTTPPSPDEASGDPDTGCTSERDTGEGWTYSSIQCVQSQTSGGVSTVSTSSSLSVNVTSTSPDDAP